ncbi:hypothetical protein SLA2020_120660 [Shorea laevis]
MLFEIGKWLTLHDYINFWSVNARFRLEAPPIPWTSVAAEGLEVYKSLPPWLMLCRKGDSICSFTDLRGHKSAIYIPDNVKRCYSRED